MLKEHGVALPPIEDHEDWCPGDYFAQVRLAIAAQERWSLDENGMILGFFSFSKLLMFRDLHPESWPGGALFSDRQLNGLLISGFSETQSLIPEDARPDEIVDTAKLPYVLDADASQALVIENARKGHDLVVQGPPGTGKSQTIANLIGAAVHDGKTVLFVAEKMAALTVVHDRLKRAGIGDACFELHSRQANKKTVIAALERALGAPMAAGPNPTEAERLREVRDRLSTASADLHAALPDSGVSPYQALAEQVSLRAAGHPVPELSIPESAAWSTEHWNHLFRRVSSLAEHVQRAGQADRHPWRGVAETGMQPADQQRLQQSTAELFTVASEISAQLSDLESLFNFDPNQPIGQLSAIAELARSVAQRPAAHAGFWDAVTTTERLERLIEIATLGLAFRTAREPVDESFVTSAVERGAEIAASASREWMQLFLRAASQGLPPGFARAERASQGTFAQGRGSESGSRQFPHPGPQARCKSRGRGELCGGYPQGRVAGRSDRLHPAPGGNAVACGSVRSRGHQQAPYRRSSWHTRALAHNRSRPA